MICDDDVSKNKKKIYIEKWYFKIRQTIRQKESSFIF
jgi:hypothetical protein